jgi:hypothetical protein
MASLIGWGLVEIDDGLGKNRLPNLLTQPLFQMLRNVHAWGADNRQENANDPHAPSRMNACFAAIKMNVSSEKPGSARPNLDWSGGERI